MNRGLKKSGLKAELIKRFENYERKKISQPKITSTASVKESQLFV
jgi:hypothetical protein